MPDIATMPRDQALDLYGRLIKASEELARIGGSIDPNYTFCVDDKRRTLGYAVLLAFADVVRLADTVRLLSIEYPTIMQRIQTGLAKEVPWEEVAEEEEAA